MDVRPSVCGAEAVSHPIEYGELAMIGRFSESIQFDVVPASSDFSVELIYPAAADGSMMRASLRVTNAKQQATASRSSSTGG